MKRSAVILACLTLLAQAACDSGESELGVDLVKRGSVFVLEVDNLTDMKLELDVDCQSNIVPGPDGIDSFGMTVPPGGAVDRRLDMFELPAELAVAAFANCTVDTSSALYEVAAGPSEDEFQFRTLHVPRWVWDGTDGSCSGCPRDVDLSDDIP